MDAKKEFKRAELAMKKALKEAKEQKNKSSSQLPGKPKVSVTSGVI
jgi:hypothetical protein